MAKHAHQYPFERVRYRAVIFSVLACAFISFFLSFFLSVAAIGITDSPKFPRAVAHVISPGNIAVGWHVSGSFLRGLGVTVWRMLAINVLYYASILLVLFALLRKHRTRLQTRTK